MLLSSFGAVYPNTQMFIFKNALISFAISRIVNVVIETKKYACLALFPFQFFFLLFYLEIIELKFCGLDEDLKKNIMERSIRDTAQKEMDININDDNISDDEDDDIEETKKKPINSKVTTTSSS